MTTKGTEVDQNTYSGFEGTDLHERLQRLGVKRLYIGGLATDYRVLNTFKDAAKRGYQVFWLRDASRAVNVNPDDGRKAADEMIRLGATPARTAEIT